MNNLLEKFTQHKSLVVILMIIFGIVIVGTVYLLPNITSVFVEDEPLIRANEYLRQNLSGAEIDYVFEDPLRTPDTVPVYPIDIPPESLFSEAAVVNIAANTGFTDKASAQQTTEGYIYTESGSTLSFNVIGGTITYSVPKENYPTADAAVLIQDALQNAREYVSAIGFDNPLYEWSEDNISLYTQEGDNLVNATFLDNEAQFHIAIPMKIGNAPLFLPREQYVIVHANGDIIGAYLWYPPVDLANAENIEIIGYAEATADVRLDNTRYVTGTRTAETTFTTSAIGYTIPDSYFYQSYQGGFVTDPVYIFSNENASVYVDAVKEQ